METRVCIITGGSRGIGLATALRMARGGARVVLVARQAGALARAAQQVRASGGSCETITADVGVEVDAQRVIATTVDLCGRVDVLVNNAGVAPLGALDTFSTADFSATLSTNIAAVFYMTRGAWGVFRRQGAGLIVNISSLAAIDPFPGFAAYGASKAWVNLFTQAVAAEGKPLGIRAFAVAPGGVETDMLRRAFPDFPRDQTLAPDDVAALVEAVCEPRFAGASGQTIYVRK